MKKKGEKLPWPKTAKDKIKLLKLQLLQASPELKKPTSIQAAIDSTPSADLEELLKEGSKVVNALFESFMKGHQDPPRLRFYYFSQFVKPGVTRPFGRFTALTLDDALEAATRGVAGRSGDAHNSIRCVFRLDFDAPCPDLDKQ